MLNVRSLDETQADASRWQAYVARRNATIYHDIAWRRIYEDSFNYRSYYLVAETVQGHLRGALPLFCVPSPLGRSRLVSVPFRDRGGPLFDDPEAFAALIGEADRLRQDIGATSVELKALDPYPKAIVEHSKLRRIDYWVNSVADLKGLTEERLLKLVNDKTRNMVRQAERAGLRVVEPEVDDAAISQWYRLHQLSQRALGLPPFPRRFFQLIFARLGEPRLARLFLVRDRGDSPVAGCIVFKESAKTVYAYSASAPGDRKVRPNDLMLLRVLCTLLEDACETFDFGSDSPSQSGLLFFKRKWLAEQRVVPRYYLSGPHVPVMTDSSASAYELPRRIVRKLPLPFARLILAPLVRYFG